MTMMIPMVVATLEEVDADASLETIPLRWQTGHPNSLRTWSKETESLLQIVKEQLLDVL